MKKNWMEKIIIGVINFSIIFLSIPLFYDIDGMAAGQEAQQIRIDESLIDSSIVDDSITNDDNSTMSSDSLKDHFANYFKIGTSVSPHELSIGADFIKKHFNSITPENELKPDSLLKQGSSDNTRCNVSLSNAAQTLKFCEQNGISLRGHTFVWYSQTPDWFFRDRFSQSGSYVSKDIMDKRLENFIKDTFEALAKEYPNLDVYSYDVCNELFINDGGGLRLSNNSNWTRIYGNSDEFVLKAFKYARMYAPKTCKLYVNDYNEYIPAKTNDIYNIAMKIKKEGNIDGIGMQSHLDVNYPSAAIYKTGMEKLLSTGLDIQITELDITTNGDYSSQANLFKDIFQFAVDHADRITAVTVWGTNDSISWRSNQNPLLFSSGYKTKEAYNAVMSIEVNTYSSESTMIKQGDISWIDPNKPMIAISFDDGTNQYGKSIVDSISNSGFHATFFYVGNWINDDSEIKYAYSKGMEIANHTMSHPYLSQKSPNDIRLEVDGCYNKLKNIIGTDPSKLLRLPYLDCNSIVQSTLNDYILIKCAIDTQDWNNASKDQIVNTIKQSIQSGSGNGAIVLCHETYSSTADAMQEVCPWIKQQGWQIVTISEMASAKGKKLNGGQIYERI